VAAQPELAGRFLFITGDTANSGAWAFLQSAHIAVLEKPFKADELLAAIARLTP
jgi:DNA-binding response OmpR family regulator